MKKIWLSAAVLFYSGSVSAVTATAPRPAAPAQVIQQEAAAPRPDIEVSPLLAGEPLTAAMPSPGMAVRLYEDESQSSVPAIIGLLAAIAAVIGLGLGLQLLRRRQEPAGTMIGLRFEAKDFAAVAPEPHAAGFVAPRRQPDPLRVFQPDAPPVKASAADNSRPDYIRIDDAVEVWTPARVEAERKPVARARRRRTDAAGADYRFHRLNQDGSVRSAQRKKFTTDGDAESFAATLSDGSAVEVWRGDRRLTTVPADFAA